MTLLEAALQYARAGWFVFPLQPGRKEPLDSSPTGAMMMGVRVDGVRGKDRATTDPEELRLWWSACPTANIGIATAPSGVVILDVDVADGKPGMASLAAWQQEHGAVPETLTQRSARLGLHMVYARPEGVEPGTRLKFAPALDLIGRGYIVVAPSTLSENGGVYQWINNKPIAPLPPALVRVLTRGLGPGAPTPVLQGMGRGDLDQTRLNAAAMELAANWPSSGRHAAQLALAGALASEGWDEEEIAAFAATVARLARPDPGYDGEYTKRLTAARSSIGKIIAGEPVAGWGSLAQHVPAPVVENVGRKLGINDAAIAMAAGIAAAAPAPPALAPGIEQHIGATLPTPNASMNPGVAVSLWDIAQNPRPPIRSYPTGFPELDRLLGGGVSTRQITALCAPPAAGKSAFATQLAINVESGVGTTTSVTNDGRLGIPVLVVSTELESDELVARYGANVANLVWRDCVRGAHRQQVIDAVAGRRIYVIGCDKLPREVMGPQGSLVLIARTIIYLTELYGISPYVIVDFVQDMVDAADDNQKTAVGGLARGLLTVVQATDSGLLAVASVARSWYSPDRAEKLREAQDATVYMSAAKESGGIDFACATILFLDIDGTQGNATDGKPGRVAAAKARHGETGFAGVRFFGASGRFLSAQEAVQAIATANVATRAMRGMARQATAQGSEADDDAKVIATATAKAQPKTLLREVCGIPAKRVESALMRCLGDGRLVLRPDTFIDDVGRAHQRQVIAAPGAPPAPRTTPAPTTARDLALSAFMPGIQAR